MLMFENGLLASFIPEFLMVLAYLFCLFVPGLQTEKQSTDCSPQIIQTQTVQIAVVSVCKVTQFHFSSENQAVESVEKFLVYPEFKKLKTFINRSGFLLVSLNQVYFSRPPPAN